MSVLVRAVAHLILPAPAAAQLDTRAGIDGVDLMLRGESSRGVGKAEVVSEQQRVVVGLTLASRPVPVLTDEPPVRLGANFVFATRDGRSMESPLRPVRMVDGVVPSDERRP